MSDYVKSTDFASKDTLPSGDSAKIVRGTEIDAEFEALEVAIASKANTSDVSSTYAPLNSPTFTGSPVLPTGTTAVTQAAGDNDTSVATTAFVTTAVAALGYPAFKNRIINGAMVISQAAAGASVTPTTTAAYPVDRFVTFEDTDGGITAQQSSTAPSGFSKSVLITVTSADSSLGAAQRSFIQQRIEGYNAADLNFGSASASTITLSFWVRSSLTGTFAVSLHNASYNRCYPTTYTINAANTWEQKTVTIAGDQSGTWDTTNGIGIAVIFNFGSGSNFQGTANAWQAGEYYMPSGTTQLIGTNGATWYITGVQLEKGSTATSFDYRPYGTELALCQRYYEKSYNNSIAIGTAITAGTGQLFVNAIGSGGTVITVNFAVSKRASPTVVSYDNAGAAGKNSYYVSSWNNNGAATVNGALEKGFNITLSGTGTLIYLNADWSATAEL